MTKLKANDIVYFLSLWIHVVFCKLRHWHIDLLLCVDIYNVDNSSCPLNFENVLVNKADKLHIYTKDILNLLFSKQHGQNSRKFD